jgi:hypothetical protein
VSWELLETAALRATGFPIELLHELRFPRSVEAASAVLSCEHEVEALRGELLRERFSAAVERVRGRGGERGELAWLSRARRAVGRRAAARPSGPPPGGEHELSAAVELFNELLERRDALVASGEEVWAGELSERRRVLRRLFEDVRLQEAVFLSSPRMHAALVRYLAAGHADARSGDARMLERRLASYLQRVCAKNETQSFFGPIDYARIDAREPERLRLRGEPAALRRREVFASQWMAEELADAISREPELAPFIRPRRSPLCRLVGSELRFVTGAAIAVDEVSAELWRVAGGELTVAELAARCEQPLDDVDRRLRELAGRGALVMAVILPGDDAYVLGQLGAWLDRLPDGIAAAARWRVALGDLRRMLDDFAAASLERRGALLREIDAAFTRLCGVAGERAGGAFYGDRAVLFEECLGGVEECVVGGELARRLDAALQPVLELWRRSAVLLAAREERAARAVWTAARGPSAAGVGLVDFLRAMRTDDPTERDEDELDELTRRMRELVRARGDGHRAELRADELPTAGALPGDAGVCPYTSLDIMLAASSADALRAGDCRIVLGEAHPQALLWVFPTAHFLAGAADAILAPLTDALACANGARPGGQLAQLAYRRKTKIHPYPLPCATIELSARRADCAAIPAADVEVRDIGGRLGLWADDRPLVLLPPLVREATGGDPLVPLSLAPVEPLDVDLGAHTPRIEIDGLIYQRERWRRPGGSIGSQQASGFELLIEAWRFKQRDELPDEVFVRVSGEPKPIYVDFRSFFSVELLEHLARASDELTISEMLPGSGELWLEGAGGSHCCELRTIAIDKERRA